MQLSLSWSFLCYFYGQFSPFPISIHSSNEKKQSNSQGNREGDKPSNILCITSHIDPTESCQCDAQWMRVARK